MTVKLTRAEYDAAAKMVDDRYWTEINKLQAQRDAAKITDGKYWVGRHLAMQEYIKALNDLGSMPEK